MKIVKKKVSDLKLAPYNPRKISKKEFEKLKRSITEFGYVEPLVWNRRTGNVVGGNQRLKVLKELGIGETYVVEVDLSLEEEKALNIALNKISGEWDFESLEELLKSLDNIDFDITLTGFDLTEFDELLVHNKKTYNKKSEQKYIETTGFVRTDDLWRLGNSKLLCADSLKKQNIERLLQGKHANLVITDPPFDMMDFGLLIKNIEFVLKNGFVLIYLDDKQVAPFIRSCNWNLDRFYIMQFQVAQPRGNDSYKMHDLVLRFKIGKAPALKNLHDGFSTVFKVNRGVKLSQKETFYHHYQKDSKPIEKFILHFSNVDDIIFDPFAGTGTILITAEKLYRKAYVMEKDLTMCEIIIRRYVQEFVDNNVYVYRGTKRIHLSDIMKED